MDELKTHNGQLAVQEAQILTLETQLVEPRDKMAIVEKELETEKKNHFEVSTENESLEKVLTERR